MSYELETGSFVPRDYQIEAYTAAANAIKKYSGPVFITASVGAGKSAMIGMVCKRAQDVGMRCLVLARQGEIIDQTSTELWGMDVKNSVYSASLNSKSTTFPIVCGTEGTIARALDKELKNFNTDILLCDENHQINWEDCLEDDPTTQYGKIIKELLRRNPKLRIIGLSGSPYRESESIVGPFWKSEIANFDTQYLIKRGYLKPLAFGFGAGNIDYDLEEFKSTGEQGIKDFTSKELVSMQRKILSEGTKTEAIMLEVIALAKSRGGVLVTCSGKRHCEEASRHLPDGSYGVVTDDISTKKRKEILDKAKSGEIKYVLQVACLSTGINIPRWDTVVLLRRIGSLTLLTQLIGRGLRTYFENKKLQKSFYGTRPEENELRQQIISASTAPDCMILDYSSTLESLGEIYLNPILESAQLSKGKFKAQLIDCPSCQTQNSQFARRCIGEDASSTDGRCEHFWQSVTCKCGALNDTSARFCRSCDAQIIDPNANLNRKHYTDADLKEVLKMTIGLTRCGNGILSRYELPDNEIATEVFYPFSDNRIAKMLWKNNFVFKHVNGLEFRRRILSCRSAGAIIGQKAIFDIPSMITHRVNDNKKSVINRKVFRSGREETNETI